MMKARMTRNIFTFCMALGLILFVKISAVNAAPESRLEKTPSNRVVAYYFHGNFRCASCRKIEQYTGEAIKKYFSEELRSGILVHKVINIEEKENRHFINDYQLYTRSVVISLVKDGKEVKYKNLAKVWEYLGNRQQFYDYVREELSKFLRQL